MADHVFPSDFREFLKLLNDAEVEYLLIGGYAVGHHGYPRTTADMDVWVAILPVLLPAQDDLRSFENTVQPMLRTVKMAFSRNRNIRRTRDLLLPRLISGTVDVPALDITVPEEAVA